jgi:hypothetical protein
MVPDNVKALALMVKARSKITVGAQIESLFILFPFLKLKIFI